MQNKKIWLAGLGVVGVAAAIGVAVTFNQGGLYTGSLSKLSTINSAFLNESGQILDTEIMKITARDGKTYALMVDKDLPVVLKKDQIVLEQSELKTNEAKGFAERAYFQLVDPSSKNEKANVTEQEQATAKEKAFLERDTASAVTEENSSSTLKVNLDSNNIFSLNELSSQADGKYLVAIYIDDPKLEQKNEFASFKLYLYSGGQQTVPQEEVKPIEQSPTEEKVIEQEPAPEDKTIESEPVIEEKLIEQEVLIEEKAVEEKPSSLEKPTKPVPAIEEKVPTTEPVKPSIEEQPVKQEPAPATVAAQPSPAPAPTQPNPPSILSPTPAPVAAQPSPAPAPTQPNPPALWSPAPTPAPTPVAPAPAVPAPKPAAVASPQPCIVEGRTFYLAEGPNSAYCKDLQALGDTFKADQSPDTLQVRYTTALAIQRMLNEFIQEQKLPLRFKVRNLSTDWYKELVDAKEIITYSSQERSDFKSVYASGTLKGRIDNATGEVTLAPLENITYIEMLSLFKQAITSLVGKTASTSDSELPAFALKYKSEPGKVWMYEAIAFGIKYNLISKNQFTASTIQDFSSRADMAQFLSKLKTSLEKDATLLRK